MNKTIFGLLITSLIFTACVPESLYPTKTPSASATFTPAPTATATIDPITLLPEAQILENQDIYDFYSDAYVDATTVDRSTIVGYDLTGTKYISYKATEVAGGENFNYVFFDDKWIPLHGEITSPTSVSLFVQTGESGVSNDSVVNGILILQFEIQDNGKVLGKFFNPNDPNQTSEAPTYVFKLESTVPAFIQEIQNNASKVIFVVPTPVVVLNDLPEKIIHEQEIEFKQEGVLLKGKLLTHESLKNSYPYISEVEMNGPGFSQVILKTGFSAWYFHGLVDHGKIKPTSADFYDFTTLWSKAQGGDPDAISQLIINLPVDDMTKVGDEYKSEKILLLPGELQNKLDLQGVRIINEIDILLVNNSHEKINNLFLANKTREAIFPYATVLDADKLIWYVNLPESYDNPRLYVRIISSLLSGLPGFVQRKLEGTNFKGGVPEDETLKTSLYYSFSKITLGQ